MNVYSKKNIRNSVFLVIIFLSVTPASAQELIIGEKIIEPGIHLIFEGAIKDDVTPHEHHLAEEETDVHIEARASWAPDETVGVPEGTPRGGFVPYMTISAHVENERTGEVTRTDLTPHINLIDNFHYARNIALPGEITDTYSVTFYVNPPPEFDLALHKDWRDNHGDQLFEGETIRYNSVDFEEIALATRR